MKINRCVCHDVKFEKIHCVATLHGVKCINELKKFIDVCDSCCKCKPYIQVILETGQTEFTKPL